MGKINIGRVVLGGFVAGLIINVFEFVLNAIVLADVWPGIMQSINRPQMSGNEIVLFNLYGFIAGFAAVWTYAAIRPRFGAGVKTAVYAGLLTWLTASFLSNAAEAILDIYPSWLFAELVVVGLVEFVVATVAGAWLYKEA
jgi:hypothetical protein